MKLDRLIPIAAFTAAAIFFATPTYAALGVCDTGYAIEIESSGGSAAGIPTGYPKLADAFSAINGGAAHLGAVHVEICASTSEIGSLLLKDTPGITAVSIKPAGGAARIVQGTFAGPMLRLSRIDNVLIDGLNSGGNSLTFANYYTSGGASTLYFTNDASGNTVTRTTLLGSSNSALDSVAGTIVVGAGTTTGNDNNTVSYCNVGPAGTSLPSKALFGQGTSASVENDNFRFQNNNVYDHFRAGGDSAGINVLEGNEGWWITGNRMFQTASRTFTASAVEFSFIRVNGSNNGNFIISNNILGFTNPLGTGTMNIGGLDNEFRAIDARVIGTLAPAAINYNTIAGLKVTSTAQNPFCGIDMAEFTGTAASATGNTIGSVNGTAGITIMSNSNFVGYSYGIRSRGFSSSTILNNDIGYIYIQGTNVGSSFYGIYAEKNPTATTAATVNVQGNRILQVSTLNAGSIIGIAVLFSAASIVNNTISDLLVISNNTSAIEGIDTYLNGSELISRNTLHSLNVNSGDKPGFISGIGPFHSNAGGVIERNLVHSLSVTTTDSDPDTSVIVGIEGSNAVWKNNMVRLGIDSAGNSITLPVRIIGLSPWAAGAALYHNSVYIGGSGVAIAGAGNTGYTSCMSTSYYSMVLKNNVFWNARANAAAGGLHYAEFFDGPVPFTSDYNVLRATGWGGQIGRHAGVDYATLSGWQTGAGWDYHSTTGNPNFVNVTGNAAAVNLHIGSGLFPTSVEGAGSNVGVTDDFDGHIRSGLSPTDIGADAGNF